MKSIVFTVALACLVFASTAQASRQCGLTARVDGVRYDVHEVRGSVGCGTVKRVVTSFLKKGTAEAPWICTRGHGSSPYAASCARGERVLIRVYAPT